MDSHDDQRGKALAERIFDVYAERCANLATKAQLTRLDWEVLTGVVQPVFGMYEISEAGVRLRPDVSAEEGSACLRFPCSPLELVSFVDQADVGGLHFELPVEFRDSVGVVENHIGWYDATLNADFWTKRSSVSPVEAATLLCRQNPAEPDCDPSAITTDETTPKDFRLLERAFVELHQSTPCHRSLVEWLKVAREQGLKFHSWITLYFEAKHDVGGPRDDAIAIHSNSPQTNDETPKDRRRRLEARKAELKKEGVKAWLQQLAKEEGVGISRIKQLLSKKDDVSNPDAILNKMTRSAYANR